jgi:type III secretion protein J
LRLVAALLGCLSLVACKVDLYTNLDERQANEMVAALVNSGIPAERTLAKNGKLSISIDQQRFAEAVEVLRSAGLPRDAFSSLGDVFKNDGLVSSPIQERARLIFALSQELAQSVSSIDGVLSARVHLALPENDLLKRTLLPSSASVFIRYRADAPVPALVPQIKMLVTNGVEGLSYDKVSVVLVPVASEVVEAPRDKLDTFLGLRLDQSSKTQALTIAVSAGALILTLAAALAALAWQVFGRRNRLRAVGPKS